MHERQEPVGSDPGKCVLTLKDCALWLNHIYHISRDHVKKVHAMGNTKGMVFPVLTFLCTVGIVLAAQSEASLDRGKALFHDPKLGTNGKSCATYHAEGKNLDVKNIGEQKAATTKKAPSSGY
jgi:hypothetical protein